MRVSHLPALFLVPMAFLPVLTGCGGGSSSPSGPIVSASPSPIASPVTTDKSVSPDGLKHVTSIPFTAPEGSGMGGYLDLYINIPGTATVIHVPSGNFGAAPVSSTQEVIWSPNSDMIFYKTAFSQTHYNVNIAVVGPTGVNSTIVGAVEIKDATGNTIKGVKGFKIADKYTFNGFSPDGTKFYFTGERTEQSTVLNGGTTNYTMDTATGLITH